MYCSDQDPITQPSLGSMGVVTAFLFLFCYEKEKLAWGFLLLRQGITM